jgi:hypothetical protein
MWEKDGTAMAPQFDKSQHEPYAVDRDTSLEAQGISQTLKYFQHGDA